MYHTSFGDIEMKKFQLNLLFLFLLFFLPVSAQDTLVLSRQLDVDSIFTILSHADERSFTLLVSPGVYWLDNPDSPEIKMNPNGEGTPYAVKIRCRNLNIIGLDPNPQNTVFAVNRGQTQGAIGNFTMISFNGRRLHTENITYGNFCNIDLVFPRDTTFNRSRRAEAIVQAQLAHCYGTDTVIVNNCHFLSRLNLCNFTGAHYAEFNNCYFECTDDALAGNSLYRHCQFTFYSSKPFYHSGNGTIFDDCEIHIKTNGTQYFTKASSPVALKNTRLFCDHPIKLAWCKDNNPSICRAENVTLNGKKARFDKKYRKHTIEKLELLSGNRQVGNAIFTFDAFETKDTRFYNWTIDSSTPSWYYGTAYDAAEGYVGYVQNQKGARMIINPVKPRASKKKSISLTACPCKSGGQGFASALGQYMDVCIVMDKDSLNGYALRIQRTPDYSNAVVVSLVRYTNGEISYLNTPQKCELFHSSCKIRVNYDEYCTMDEGAKLSAVIKHDGKKLLLEESISKNSNNTFIIQHTGSVGSSATLLKDIKCKW